MPVPPNYKDDKFVQLILSAYEFQKSRADKAENDIKDYKTVERVELIKSRDEWKSLYTESTRSIKDLQSANVDFRVSIAELKTANQAYKDQKILDNQFIADKDRQISKLKRDRFKWAGISFVFGIGTGYLASNYKR